ncbi:MAG: SIMPL domain-containing protein [Myxococcota bacterium]
MKLASLFVVVLAGSLVGAPRAGAQIQVGETPRHRAAFQVEAVREIANDWVTARLSVVAEGQQPAAVAAAVNEAMARATTQAKRVADVDVRSGAYVTHPVTRRSDRPLARSDCASSRATSIGSRG